MTALQPSQHNHFIKPTQPVCQPLHALKKTRNHTSALSFATSTKCFYRTGSRESLPRVRFINDWALAKFFDDDLQSHDAFDWWDWQNAKASTITYEMRAAERYNHWARSDFRDVHYKRLQHLACTFIGKLGKGRYTFVL